MLHLSTSPKWIFHLDLQVKYKKKNQTVEKLENGISIHETLNMGRFTKL